MNCPIASMDKLETAPAGNWFLEHHLVIARLDKLARDMEAQKKLQVPENRYFVGRYDLTSSLPLSEVEAEVKKLKGIDFPGFQAVCKFDHLKELQYRCELDFTCAQALVATPVEYGDFRCRERGYSDFPGYPFVAQRAVDWLVCFPLDKRQDGQYIPSGWDAYPGCFVPGQTEISIPTSRGRSGVYPRQRMALGQEAGYRLHPASGRYRGRHHLCLESARLPTRIPNPPTRAPPLHWDGA